MKTKYQIFVSSTYEDLKEDRDIVIKSILEMGHIPVGMEMFSAGDEEQWSLIKKQIDDSDYYIVIVAHRYGSLDGNISYTEKEYDYASSINIPTLGFLINESVSWPAFKIDKEPKKVKALKAFKEKIKKKIIAFWDNKTDLYGKTSIALMKQFNTNPRVGWVRANKYNGPEILAEISRLSKENSELRNEIEKANTQSNLDEKKEEKKILTILRHNKRQLQFFYIGETDWKDRTEYTLFQIFNVLAPEMLIENSLEKCSRILGIVFNPRDTTKVRAEWATPSNTVRKILADLNVLNLIEPSNKQHKVADNNEYWTLSKKGKQIYKIVREEVMEKNLPIDKDL
jgi:hypothetical protein